MRRLECEFLTSMLLITSLMTHTDMKSSELEMLDFKSDNDPKYHERKIFFIVAS